MAFRTVDGRLMLPNTDRIAGPSDSGDTERPWPLSWAWGIGRAITGGRLGDQASVIVGGLVLAYVVVLVSRRVRL